MDMDSPQPAADGQSRAPAQRLTRTYSRLARSNTSMPVSGSDTWKVGGEEGAAPRPASRVRGDLRKAISMPVNPAPSHAPTMRLRSVTVGPCTSFRSAENMTRQLPLSRVSTLQRDINRLRVMEQLLELDTRMESAPQPMRPHSTSAPFKTRPGAFPRADSPVSPHRVSEHSGDRAAPSPPHDALVSGGGQVGGGRSGRFAGSNTPQATHHVRRGSEKALGGSDEGALGKIVTTQQSWGGSSRGLGEMVGKAGGKAAGMKGGRFEERRIDYDGGVSARSMGGRMQHQLSLTSVTSEQSQSSADTEDRLRELLDGESDGKEEGDGAAGNAKAKVEKAKSGLAVTASDGGVAVPPVVAAKQADSPRGNGWWGKGRKERSKSVGPRRTFARGLWSWGGSRKNSSGAAVTTPPSKPAAHNTGSDGGATSGVPGPGGSARETELSNQLEGRLPLRRSSDPSGVVLDEQPTAEMVDGKGGAAGQTVGWWSWKSKKQRQQQNQRKDRGTVKGGGGRGLGGNAAYAVRVSPTPGGEATQDALCGVAARKK